VFPVCALFPASLSIVEEISPEEEEQSKGGDGAAAPKSAAAMKRPAAASSSKAKAKKVNKVDLSKKVRDIDVYDSISKPKDQPMKDASMRGTKRKADVLTKPRSPSKKSQKISKDSLPRGWKKTTKKRKSGKSKGHVDTYFWSPDGSMLRSIPEVLSFLAAGGA